MSCVFAAIGQFAAAPPATPSNINGCTVNPSDSVSLQLTFVLNCFRPPLWSSGQSSWLQIQRPGFDSRHYQEKKSSGSGSGSTQPREYN
jgi:hypothetical protein